MPRVFKREKGNSNQIKSMISHSALNTVFGVESFSVDAMVLMHDCFKTDGDAYRPIVSGKDLAHLHGFARCFCDSMAIGVGAQSTLGGHQIFARKMY